MSEQHETIHALRGQGLPYSAIADRLGYASSHAVRGVYYRWLNDRQPAGSETLNSIPRLDLSRYDHTPQLTGNWLVISDVHIPTTRWPLLDLAVRFGVKQMPRGQRQLLILGDLVNFDAVSHHPHTTPAVSLSAELDMAAGILEDLLRHFDRVVYTLGNHEDRLLKALSGALYDHAFTTLLTRGAKDGRIALHMGTRARIESDGIVWHATHQRNYSAIKNRVAAELALKEQANIISAHQHHVSAGRDKYNRYTTIDSGGLFDARRLAYVSRTDSTSPTMCNGFVFVRHGVGHLLTPYESMTDWGLWRMQGEAAAAIADCAEREVAA